MIGKNRWTNRKIEQNLSNFAYWGLWNTALVVKILSLQVGEFWPKCGIKWGSSAKIGHFVPSVSHELLH
jgi:hypothetical protein